MIATTDLGTDATAILDRLVAFDTTSRESNLAMIAFLQAHFAALGAETAIVGNAAGTKANLYATIGPMVAGGVILSGHTDVVPVDGQAWSSDPFALAMRDDRLYGRGTSDMKAFIALAMAVAPSLAAAPIRRPVHFAFSYDEEIGCLGAPDMIRQMRRNLPTARAVIVGEPTGMAVVAAHKGVATYHVTVHGHEAHSSLTHLGASANAVAVRLLGRLHDLADALEREASANSPFTPAHSTLTIGTIQGGTALNILARECVFGFDLRTVPGRQPAEILAPFMRAVEQADLALRGRFPAAGVSIVQGAAVPPLAPEVGGEAAALARSLSGDKGPAGAVAYGAEAGQFQQAGFSTVICGPGSIEQAHQPDEYIELEQIRRGAAFMNRLVEVSVQ